MDTSYCWTCNYYKHGSCLKQKGLLVHYTDKCKKYSGRGYDYKCSCGYKMGIREAQCYKCKEFTS